MVRESASKQIELLRGCGDERCPKLSGGVPTRWFGRALEWHSRGGERLNGIQEVRGSIPLISTRKISLNVVFKLVFFVVF